MDTIGKKPTKSDLEGTRKVLIAVNDADGTFKVIIDQSFNMEEVYALLTLTLEHIEDQVSAGLIPADEIVKFH